MRFKLLSDGDMKAIDALKEHHGGAERISETIEAMRELATRKRLLTEKGYGPMIADAEELVKRFPKVPDFERAEGITANGSFGTATSQVSGFQGAKVTHRCMQRMAESASSEEPCWVPAEMISVVALTDSYVYGGDLMATLTMTENIMKTSRFCSTNLIGIPQPESRFVKLEQVTGKVFERADLGDGLSAVTLKNMGTAYGNLGGVEVANDNHLVYLDGVTRAAVTTGADFFLNPSWSTIIAACYYARDIPNLRFKISMLLSTQNLMQLRMLINIMSEYQRDDGASAIREINIGNGVSDDNFINCSQEMAASGVKDVSLAAHIFINPDLGAADFDWTENAHAVLLNGTDLTYKYESDGTRRELDTMEAYFLPEDERDAKAEAIGDVIYHKSLQASKDGRDMMRRGIRAVFGGASY